MITLLLFVLDGLELLKLKYLSSGAESLVEGVAELSLLFVGKAWLALAPHKGSPIYHKSPPILLSMYVSSVETLDFLSVNHGGE